MTRDAALQQLTQDVSQTARQGALDVARSILTEEKTDALIAILVPKIKAAMPGWLRWLPVGYVLDKLLPGTILSVLEEVLS